MLKPLLANPATSGAPPVGTPPGGCHKARFRKVGEHSLLPALALNAMEARSVIDYAMVAAAAVGPQAWQR